MKTIVFLICLILLGISSSITFYILYSHNQKLNYFGNKSQQDGLWLLPQNKNVDQFYESYSLSGEIIYIENDDLKDGSNVTINIKITDQSGEYTQVAKVSEKPEAQISFFSNDGLNEKIKPENFLSALKAGLFIQVTMVKHLNEENYKVGLIELYENN